MANYPKDKATDQLLDFKQTKSKPDQVTTSLGAPVGDRNAIQTVGPRGPVVMQDFVFMDELAHFQRERIPERVVHAKGSGAHGYFEVTHDITKYCKAKLFKHIGKKTPIFIRFSTVGGEKGSADTARDPRGFAIKFYTEEGNWDLTGNNVPIFFIKDPMFFASFVHTQKRNPRTNLKDPDMFWDFLSLRPESNHHVAFLFTDRGTPDGFRHMNGYGSHTFKMVNAQGEAVYVKFHSKTNQGIKNLSRVESDRLILEDPDYATRDLFNAIANGDFPSWTFYIQVMTFAEAEKFRYNPFDLTKVWPQGEFPLIPVGRFTLNRNPKNHFAEVEQAAFAPAHMVPEGAPNYFPNSFTGPVDNPKYTEHVIKASGDVARYNTDDEDNTTQVAEFWNKVLKPAERTALVENLAAHLRFAKEFIQKRQVNNLRSCVPEFGNRVQALLDQYKKNQASANL